MCEYLEFSGDELRFLLQALASNKPMLTGELKEIDRIVSKIKQLIKVREEVAKQKVKCIVMRPNGGGRFNSVIIPLRGQVEKTKDQIYDYLRDSETGDEWNLKIIEMTNKDIDNLPEFDGF